MHDFEQEMTPDRVILRPLSDVAKKYLESRQGFYQKFYKDASMKFELPRQKWMFEDYRKRLMQAKFTIREGSERAATAQ